MDDRKPDRTNQAGLIEWVFLDVGNVLYNDDPQNFEGYRFVFEAIRSRLPDYSFADMLAEREEWAKTGADFILRKIVRRLLPETDPKSIFGPLRERFVASYDQNNILNDGAREVLDGSARGGGWASSPTNPPNAGTAWFAAACPIFSMSSPSAMSLNCTSPTCGSTNGPSSSPAAIRRGP